MPLHYISTIFHRYYSSYHHLFPCGDCVTDSFTLRRYPQFSRKSQYVCAYTLLYRPLRQYIMASSSSAKDNSSRINKGSWRVVWAKESSRDNVSSTFGRNQTYTSGGVKGNLTLTYDLPNLNKPPGFVSNDMVCDFYKSV